MLSNRIFLLFFFFFPGILSAQSWRNIPNLTQGCSVSFHIELTDKWGKHHVFVGFRRSNSVVGNHNPLFYYQVEKRKLQVFDMISGVINKPIYDSTLDVFIGTNSQPLHIWRITANPSLDSASIHFFTNENNLADGNTTFSFRKEKNGWYYGATTPRAKFFRFDPISGKIENLGQAENTDESKNARRTAFHHTITPQGWAINYRSDKSGVYHIYYKNEVKNYFYDYNIGKESSPTFMANAKDGSEVLAIRKRTADKKLVYIILDPQGKELVNSKYRFPEDFESLPVVPINRNDQTKGVEKKGNRAVCTYLKEGKLDSFYMDLPVDLQEMKWVTFLPKFGWVGTPGVYQDIYFIDSFPNSQKFAIENHISTYHLGGTDELFVLGYPSKVAVLKKDSLKFIINSNKFPKYFIDLAEIDGMYYFLGKNDRDRTGNEIWKYNPKNDSLENPWKKQIDSISISYQCEKLENINQRLFLFARSKSTKNLVIWELKNQKLIEVVLPSELKLLLAAPVFSVSNKEGNIVVWKNDSIGTFNVLNNHTGKITNISLKSVENLLIAEKSMAVVGGDRAIFSGINTQTGRTQLISVHLKNENKEILKSDFTTVRPFTYNQKDKILLFGGDSTQNVNFEEFTFPAHWK